MTLPLTCQTASAGETEQLGRQLADWLLREPSLPSFVALYGDLGVGKTAFVRGFTAALAPDARVKSPTFSLVHEYRSAHRSVFHFDMYRIESEDDLYSIGFWDYLEGDGFVMIEWTEQIDAYLSDGGVFVTISRVDGDVNSRTITIDEHAGTLI